MKKKIIAGNWKMNGTKASVQSLLEAVKSGESKIKNPDLHWIVFPPFVFLCEAQRMLTDSNISWGAQNLSPYQNGAYTGEISASMLKEFDCKYVLIGHSERRHLFGETNEIAAKKFTAACQAGISPILCVGETLDERNAGDAKKIVEKQIDAVLKTSSEPERDLENAIIAYEPVWAIGTGINATPEQAQEMHYFIRQKLAKVNPKLAENMQILYGGSLKPSNARSLFAMPDIDGGLIGGASLIADDFLNIGKVCKL